MDYFASSSQADSSGIEGLEQLLKAALVHELPDFEKIRERAIEFCTTKRAKSIEDVKQYCDRKEFIIALGLPRKAEVTWGRLADGLKKNQEKADQPRAEHPRSALSGWSSRSDRPPREASCSASKPLLTQQ